MIRRPSQYRPSVHSIRTFQSETVLPKAVEKSRLIVINGPPTSGKSTLLRQSAAYLLSQGLSPDEGSLIYIELSQHYRLRDITSDLCSGLNFSSLKAGSENEILSQLESVLEFADARKVTLLIDDLDHLDSPEVLLSLIELYFRHARLICTTSRIPHLSPGKLGSFYIVSHPGLGNEEIRQIIEVSPLYKSLSTQDPRLADEITDRSSGNPLLAKTLLAQVAQLSEKAIALRGPAVSVEIAQIQLWSTLSQRFSPRDFDLLQMASLVKFSTRCLAKLLSELSTHVLELLGSIGILRGSAPELTLSPVVAEFLRTSLTQSRKTEYREKLLREFSDPEEQVAQLVELARAREAVSLIEKMIPGISTKYEESDFLRLLPDYALLSLPLREAKAMICARMQLFDVILREVPHDIELGQSKTLLFALGQAYRHLGPQEEALKTLNRAISLSNQSESIYYQASAELLYTESKLYSTDYHSKFVTLLDLFERSRLKDPLTHARLLFATAANLERHARCRETIPYFEKAVPLFQDAHARREAAYGLNMLGINMFNCGETDQALEHIDKSDAIASKYGDFFLSASAANARSYIYVRTGQHKKLESFYQSRIGTPPPSLQALGPHLGALMHTIDSAIVRRDIELARVRTVHALSVVEKAQNMQYLSRIRFRHSILYAFLDPAAHVHRFSQLLKETHGELEHRFVLNLGLAFELNFQSDFRFNLEPYATYKPKLNTSYEDLDYTCVFTTLQGIYHIFLKRWNSARELLMGGLSSASKYQLPLWIARAHLFLALLSLRDNDISASKAHLEKVRNQLPKFDPHPEFELELIFSAAVLIREGRLSELRDHLEHLKPTIDLTKFLKHKLLSQFLDLNGNTPPSTLWADLIFESLNLVHDPEVVLTSPRGRTLARVSSIEKYLKPRPDLILNLVDNTFSYRGAKLPLTDKRTLLELLIFLLKHSLELFTKEDLTQRVWKERYNPIVHDPRIYTSIKRLRTICKGKSTSPEVIRTVKDHYGVAPKVTFAIIEAKSPYSDLSQRQQWILNYLRENPSVDRQTIEELLAISPTLVKQELKSLLDRGLIARSGRARATTYHAKI